MTKLELNSLEMSFGAFNAVDNVNLSIGEGEFVSLLGPSGCGKTTTLRMIAGFLQPTGGSITLDGRTLSSSSHNIPPEKRGMSMIFQSYAIWPNMTVAENVGFGLKLRSLSRQTIYEQTMQMLETVKLRHLADRYPAELSGGQQQRVALARAIVVRPNVFLLDEPLSNLDANLREEMRIEIRRLHDEFNMTTVYVTHDQAEAMSASDRIAVMNCGSIEQVASPHDIYNRPATRFVAEFIGRTNILKGGRSGDVAAVLGSEFHLPDGSKRIIAGPQTPDVSIRPRSIQILPEDATTLRSRTIQIPGTVVSRSYMGESWEYVIRCRDSAGAELKVSALPNVDHCIGNQVRLGIMPEDLVFLQDATQDQSPERDRVAETDSRLVKIS